MRTLRGMMPQVEMTVAVEFAESLQLPGGPNQEISPETNPETSPEINQELMVNWVAALAEDPMLSDYSDALAGDICIRFCDEGESADTNSTYRGRDYPTNVLSFPAEVTAPDVAILGDLLICLPVVLAEAASQKKSPDHHLRHLVLHGVLHLLGFDHVEERQAQQMEDLERNHLARFGIPDPY